MNNKIKRIITIEGNEQSINHFNKVIAKFATNTKKGEQCVLEINVGYPLPIEIIRKGGNNNV